MPSKQPLYTALGFVTWHVGKRAIKRKIVGSTPGRRRRRFLLLVVVLGGTGATAYLKAAAPPSRPTAV